MINQLFPVVPLRDVVLFPGIIMPLFIARARTRAAVEKSPGPLFFVAQRDAALDTPSEGDLFDLGTLGDVLEAIPLPDGSQKIVVRGSRRARRLSLRDNGRFLEAELALLGAEAPATAAAGDIRDHIDKAARTERSAATPWPVASIQKLLEDDSLSDLERVKRLRELGRFK
jgi:ATP-dependent Lon protease